MSLLRTIGKIAGGIIFTLFLMSLVFSYSFSQITAHDNIKPVFSNLMKEQIVQSNETKLSDLKTGLVYYCNQTTSDSVVLSVNNINFSINCPDVYNKTPEQLLDMVFGNLFDKIYYKEYNCDFISCVKNGLSNDGILVLISSKANNFFNEMIIYSLIGVIIGLLLLILSIRNLFRIIKSVGITMIVTGLPFLVFYWLKSYFINSAPAAANQLIEYVFGFILNPLLIVFALGIVLAIAGYVGAYLSKEDNDVKNIKHAEKTVDNKENHTIKKKTSQKKKKRIA